MPESARRQYVTVTREGLTIEGWKEVTLSALLGLPDIDDDTVAIHTGKKPRIEKNGLVEQVHSLGAHLHAAAMVLPGFHKPNEIKLDNSINSRYNPSKPTTLIIGEVGDISQQAIIPKQLRQPPQPTKQEQEQHRITHMPYRSWCPISNGNVCQSQRTVNSSSTWRSEGTILDTLALLVHSLELAYNKKWQVHTILTCVETITSLPSLSHDSY
eukprot:3213058-Amphidinium_carterae.1